MSQSKTRSQERDSRQKEAIGLRYGSQNDEARRLRHSELGFYCYILTQCPGRIRQPLLRNIPRSKTSLVVLTSLIPKVPGSGKSTLPANVTIDWAEFKDDRSNDLILCFSLWRD